jgi:hypothetical protein
MIQLDLAFEIAINFVIGGIFARLDILVGSMMFCGLCLLTLFRRRL